MLSEHNTIDTQDVQMEASEVQVQSQAQVREVRITRKALLWAIFYLLFVIITSGIVMFTVFFAQKQWI